MSVKHGRFQSRAALRAMPFFGGKKMSIALKLLPNTGISKTKDYINRRSTETPREGVLFTDFVIATAQRKSKRMSPSYMKSYTTLCYHVDNFSKKFDANIFTNSVNEEFLDDFILYLESCNLRMNYIKNIVGLVKAMASKAGSYGYAIDPSFDNVVLDDEQTFSVYLSMNEITRIYYFRGLSLKKQKIRDIFVLGCLTALRYSDYSQLTQDNFIENNIVKVTKKTNTKVVIPLHDYVREIYSRYGSEITLNLSIQHFNRYVKEICQEVGLCDEIKYSYTRGSKVVTEVKQKWELISSHTARRSAATNMHLTRRMSTHQIMAITGHTTEKSFFRYIRLSYDEISQSISADPFFKK